MPSLRRAFTLIELLVVIAIIAVLAAILFPVFAKAREKARQTVCISNMKQISSGIYMYAQDHDEMLPTTADDGRTSWIDQIVPYVKNDAVRRCPSDTGFDLDTLHRSSYGVNNYFAVGFSLAQAPAPATTIYSAELADNAIRDHFHPMYWNGADADEGSVYVEGKPTELAWGRHNEGSNFAFLDSHAKWYHFERTFSPPRIDLYNPQQ